METKSYQSLVKAKQLMDAGDPDAAWDLINSELEKDPNCVPALMDAALLHDRARRIPLSYQIAARTIELAPKYPEAWNTFGRAAERLFRIDEAKKAYMTAINLMEQHTKPELIEKRRERMAAYVNNLASVHATGGDFAGAERIALDALSIIPEYRIALGNLGLAQLGQRKWREGWPNYDKILGSEVRKFVKYREDLEPTWQGEPDKRVVIYGEQGLGDELSFASMIPDAIRICRKVIIDCDIRLEGLFRRSFPEATVYGTRWEKGSLYKVWDDMDQRPDMSCSIGQLGGIFRNEDSDFPGTPYIVPDPDRVAMWKTHFARIGKPVIGITWSGGETWTASNFRRWTLDQLQPIFDAVDAHWVSLQWKDDKAEIEAFKGAEIARYPYAIQTKDYDDTAALVAALDQVIGMQTSVCHLAAAMGIETWTFVNKYSQWRYGTDEMLWYKAMKLYRQAPSGKWPIEDAAKVLALRHSVRKRA